MNLGGTVKLNPVGVLVLLGLSFILLLYMLAGRSFSSNEDLNLKQLLIAAINVATRGGDVIRELSRKNVNTRSKGIIEGVPNVVTDADYASHCIMYYSLRTTFPSLKIVSEEKNSISDCQLHKEFGEVFALSPDNAKINEFVDVVVPAKDVTVWIDPLDATKEFTEKLFQYVTTMVCVAVRGKPVIGVIHQPFHTPSSTTSWVWDQLGESADLSVKKAELNIKNPVIMISRSHAGNVSNIIKKSMPDAEVREAGGAGYKVLRLIEGKASAYFHTTVVNKWDLCAGNAMLNHFGGRLSTLDSKDIDYSNTETRTVGNGILAAVKEHDYFYHKLGTHTT